MKLVAADSEDMEILSARLQDATALLKDIAWLPKQRRFAALFNRYRWEDSKTGKGLRVRAGLHFESVLKVQSQNIKRGAPDAVVSLLAVRFTPNPRDAAGLEEKFRKLKRLAGEEMVQGNARRMRTRSQSA